MSRSVIVCPTAAGAQTPTLVQHKAVNTGAVSATQAFSYTSSIGAGHLLTIFVGYDPAHVPSGISDTVNGAWSALTARTHTVDIGGQWFYFKNCAAGSPTVTLTLASSGDCAMLAQEWSGVDLTSPFDVQGVNDGSSNSPVSAAATTTAAGELILGGFDLFAAFSAVGASFTLIDNSPSPYSVVAEYRIQASAGSISAGMTMTGVNEWVACMATFKHG